MRRLSNAISSLYSAAENASLSDFQREVFQIIQNWISFDGGVLCSGEASNRCDALAVSTAYQFGRDENFLNDYIESLPIDPNTDAFSRGLINPIVCETKPFYRNHGLTCLEWFVQKHDLNHLLLFGDTPRASEPGRWIVLYRRDSTRFSQQDSEIILALWPHLSRAIRMNLKGFLDASDPRVYNRAMALLNQRGAIEMADPTFLQLIKQEWRTETRPSIPRTVLAHLRVHGHYEGESVIFNAHVQGELIVCEACRKSVTEKLGRLEKLVACQFIEGANYKQIALKMGTSPNTVRNQISQVYRKLNVHDKVALARLVDIADFRSHNSYYVKS